MYGPHLGPILSRLALILGLNAPGFGDVAYDLLSDLPAFKRKNNTDIYTKRGLPYLTKNISVAEYTL